VWYASKGSGSEWHTTLCRGLEVGRGSLVVSFLARNSFIDAVFTNTFWWSLVVEGPSVCERYEAYRSGSVCWKFSSSGPRFVHMSEVWGSCDDSAGVQCAAEGVKIAAGAASATIVHRQCVRVGAADAVERRIAVANSEVADAKSILICAKVSVACSAEGFPVDDMEIQSCAAQCRSVCIYRMWW
jgi:hypothetical protein